MAPRPRAAPSGRLAACALLALAAAAELCGDPRDAPELLAPDEAAACMGAPQPCNSEPGEWEVICDLRETEGQRYKTQIIFDSRHNLHCSSISNLNVKDIPRLNLKGHTKLQKYFSIRYCPMPNISYAEVIKYLGFTSTRKLKIHEIAGDTAMQRRHLEGLDALNVTSLDLHGSGIRDVPEDLFQDMSKLIFLDLNGNELRLKRNVFRNLNSLKVLRMSQCGLTALPPGLFSLPALQELFLESNRLQLQSDTFAGSLALKLLSLNGNRLRDLPRDVFADLPDLEEIILDNNNFSRLPEELFRDNSNLKRFTLTRSQELKTLPHDLFQNFKRLTFVDLSHNGLESIPERVFENSKEITEMILHHNEISVLHENVFSSQIFMKKLNLSSNKIKTLPENVFRNLFNLRVLDINDNAIKLLQSKVFAKLLKMEQLSLKSNYLNAMDDSQWGQLTYPAMLNELNVANNGLTYIPLSFQHFYLENLTRLDLSYNNISEINKFLGNLEFYSNQELEVDLSYNNIQMFYIPDYKTRLAALSHSLTIIIQNNPVTCDCTLFPFSVYRTNAHSSDKLKIDTGGTKCAAPASLAATRLSNILPKDLICEHKHGNAKCSLKEVPYNSTKIIDCSNGAFDKTDTIESIMKNMQPEKGFFNTVNRTVVNICNNSIENIGSLGRIPEEVIALNLRRTNLKPNGRDIPAHIEDLDLGDNGFENINETIAQNMLGSNRSVYLSGNYFACDCSNVKFLVKLFEQSESVKDFKELMCSNATRTAGPRVAEVQVETLCTNQPTELIALSVVAVLLAVVALIFCRYNIAFKAWLVNNYEWPRNILLKKFSTDIRQLKKDVFLSYSYEDEEDMDTIMNYLKEKGYTTINHRDDWLGGGSILDSIEESIQISQTTIFLVSTHFVESKWGTHEFRVAFAKLVTERSTNIVVVMKGETDAIIKKNKIIKTYIKSFTYLKRDDPNFLNRLTLSLPERLADRYAKMELSECDNCDTDGALDNEIINRNANETNLGSLSVVLNDSNNVDKKTGVLDIVIHQRNTATNGRL